LIVPEHALLAATKPEPVEIDAQGKNVKFCHAVNRGSVAKEKDTEVAPSLRPEAIHLTRRYAETKKVLLAL
jgi:hypothetical protein